MTNLGTSKSFTKFHANHLDASIEIKPFPIHRPKSLINAPKTLSNTPILYASAVIYK
jgi:hypothetical protein